MGRDSEDKAGRILSIYTRLKQGKVIYKQEESIRYGVAERTIQRDIVDIQCFLEEHASTSGEIQEIIFEKALGGYVLQTKKKTQLEEKELLAVAKILLESRALTKQELYPIIHKLIHLCSNEADMKLLRELIKNEEFHYVELRHGKPLLDSIWKLEQAVKAQQYLEIEYQKLKNHEVVNRKVKPVGVIFSEFYFYLVAYIDGIDNALKAQQIIKGYNAEMQKLNQQLDLQYTRVLVEIQKAFQRFKDLEQLAFDENVNIAFQGSISLASEVGVADEQILRTKQDIDNFFII